MKTINKKGLSKDEQLRQALAKFDLKAFERWMKKFCPTWYKVFSSLEEDVRMATMCRQITRRSDMLATEANTKAIRWMAKHGEKGAMMF